MNVYIGRLPIEIAGRGYYTQGNEFSVYMILASNFMLNGISNSNQYTVYPWLDKYVLVYIFTGVFYKALIIYIYRVCNVVHSNDPLVSITVPDVTAYDILHKTLPNSSTQCDAHSAPDNYNENSSDIPRFSFAAGDFVEVYNIPSNYLTWHSVVTCFFLDTAPIVMQ